MGIIASKLIVRCCDRLLFCQIALSTLFVTEVLRLVLRSLIRSSLFTNSLTKSQYLKPVPSEVKLKSFILFSPSRVLHLSSHSASTSQSVWYGAIPLIGDLLGTVRRRRSSSGLKEDLVHQPGNVLRGHSHEIYHRSTDFPMRVVQCVRHLTAASDPASVCPNGVPSGIRGLGELFCYSYYAIATILLHLFAVLPLVIADLNYCWKP